MKIESGCAREEPLEDTAGRAANQFWKQSATFRRVQLTFLYVTSRRQVNMYQLNMQR
jgi:hypothetical protein